MQLVAQRRGSRNRLTGFALGLEVIQLPEGVTRDSYLETVRASLPAGYTVDQFLQNYAVQETYPDREPGEETIRFDDALPGGSTDYVSAEEEMPEEITWVQQMSALPKIIQQFPRARVQKIGIITLPNTQPAVLIGLGSVGLAASLIGGYVMIREAIAVDYSLARIALITGGLTAGLLFLHSALALAAGLSPDPKAAA